MVENWDNKKDSKLEYEIRKVHGIMGEISYWMTLPKNYALDIGIGKGDFVKVTRDSKRIIIESLLKKGDATYEF